jgi:uracil-DNA glycosylase
MAPGMVIERDGRKYLVTYHPAVRFYRKDLAENIREDLNLLRKELQKA